VFGTGPHTCRLGCLLTQSATLLPIDQIEQSAFELPHPAWTVPCDHSCLGCQEALVQLQPLDKTLALFVGHPVLEILPRHLPWPAVRPSEHEMHIIDASLQTTDEEANVDSDSIKRRLIPWVPFGSVQSAECRAYGKEFGYSQCDLRRMSWKTISKHVQPRGGLLTIVSEPHKSAFRHDDRRPSSGIGTPLLPPRRRVWCPIG
jgi:hypothetical protein